MKGHNCNAEIYAFIYCGDIRSSTSLQIAEKTQRKDTYVQNLDTYLSLTILMTCLGVFNVLFHSSLPM